ncbi:hypothetical protein TanjilG_14030 [Lupinus angustifolius]|uniref:Uncharacterized protein n=1 Tax=Lupinus angustifolius TaxID=3871 RepID=A0A1J7GJN0_LUPAN|nr:hypothetical protein TanjilG_14030 [Lupinus angustifolius]
MSSTPSSKTLILSNLFRFSSVQLPPFAIVTTDFQAEPSLRTFSHRFLSPSHRLQSALIPWCGVKGRVPFLSCPKTSLIRIRERLSRDKAKNAIGCFAYLFYYGLLGDIRGRPTFLSGLTPVSQNHWPFAEHLQDYPPLMGIGPYSVYDNKGYCNKKSAYSTSCSSQPSLAIFRRLVSLLSLGGYTYYNMEDPARGEGGSGTNSSQRPVLDLNRPPGRRDELSDLVLKLAQVERDLPLERILDRIARGGYDIEAREGISKPSLLPSSERDVIKLMVDDVENIKPIC